MFKMTDFSVDLVTFVCRRDCVCLGAGEGGYVNAK